MRGKVCGAKTRAGTPCRETKLYPNGRCYRHGGPSLGGVAHPNWKTGRWSKYVPRHLGDAYEEARTDPDLTSLREDLELLTVRVSVLLQRLEEAPPSWDDLVAAWAAVEAGLDEGGDPAALVDTLVAFWQFLQDGREQAARQEGAWAEIREVIAERTRTSLAESRRLADLSQMVPKEKAFALMHLVVETVRGAVLDKATYSRGPRAVLNRIHQALRQMYAGQDPDVVEGGPVVGGDPPCA
jgi:hypothetical protein